MSDPRSIDLASSGNPKVREMLLRHPRVGEVRESKHAGIDFQVGDWQRRVVTADVHWDQYGLVEIVDNNPMVCEDVFSVPSASATLALVALAPLALAGILADSPVLVFNWNSIGYEAEICAGLSSLGLPWDDRPAIHSEPLDLGSVLACTAMASIKTPEDPDEIDELFTERYGRSFYVRRDDSSEWSPELVRGQPHAVYRLSIAVDHPHCLLTIRVLADRDGKCGAAQAVHAMNVMCGFEETLGIS